MKISQIQNNVLFYQFFVFIQMKEKECLECDRMHLSIETPKASKVCSRAFDLSCKWLVYLHNSSLLCQQLSASKPGAAPKGISW